MGDIGQGAIIDGFAVFLRVLLYLVLLFKVFTFIDAAIRPSRGFEAAGKLTKVGWMVILAVAVAVDVLLRDTAFGLILISAGLVAAIVYTVDVRPAVRQLTSKKKKRANGQHDGPW